MVRREARGAAAAPYRFVECLSTSLSGGRDDLLRSTITLSCRRRFLDAPAADLSLLMAASITRRSTATRDSKRDMALSLRRLVVVIVLGGVLAGHDRLGDDAGILSHLRFDLGGHVGIVLEELLRVLAALPDAL